MKQVLLTLAIVSALISCNNSKEPALQTDLAVINPAPVTNDYSTDKPANDDISDGGRNKTVVYVTERKPVKIVYRDAPAKASNPMPANLPTAPAIPPVNTQTGVADSTQSSAPIQPGKDDNASINKADTALTQPAVKKKGWNNATKGAVLGGVVGAAGGAIISKKKGAGAIIGGVVGAAGGYIFGRARDKKAASEFTY